MAFHIRSLGAMALCAAMVGCAPLAENAAASSAAASFSFGVWGDMPYQKAGDGPRMAAVLDSINRSDVAFSIFDGDIKDGSSRCDDAVFAQALTMFNGLKKPLVYVPGDNEWTDCHRTNNGGFDALERLEYLRRVMFSSTDSLGQQRMPLQHQGAVGKPYVENTRFRHGPVQFVTLNVPGSNNNLVLNAKECSEKSVRKQAQCDAANAEYLARDTANLAWLTESFRQARELGLRGVVVTIQADPGFDLPETSEDESKNPQYSGYRAFVEHLSKLTADFGGEVLLVHGDTHFFKVDKPLHSPAHMLTNFTRLQTFGSPSLHWVRVVVDSASTQLFRIEPVIVRHAP